MHLARPILYGVTIFVSILLLLTPARDIGAGVIAGLVVVAIDLSAKNVELLRFLLDSIRYSGKPVRLSISYLYRIRLNNQYLLVRGHRIKDQYQPVGGVIKHLPEATASLLKFEATDDDLIPIDKTSKNDLRIILGNGKHLFNFMRWYDSGEGRETDCWREFYEELVRPGILPRDIFGYVSTRHLRRHVTPVEFSNHVQKYECLISEIYELIPTADQEAELRKLQRTDSSEYIFATEDEIRREGVIAGQPRKRKISPTSSWIL